MEVIMNLCKCGREFSNNGAFQSHIKVCDHKIDFNKISQIMRLCCCSKTVVYYAIKNEAKRSKSDIAILAHKDMNRRSIKINCKVCEICNRSISVYNFKRHYDSHILEKNYTAEQLKIRCLYDDENSIHDILKMGYARSLVRKTLHGHRRCISEAGKLAHKTKTDSFKLNEIAKDKIRKARLRYLKEHPEDTAWRTKNISYPEKIFKNIIENNNLTKQYDVVREYSVFPYFIDFAFVNIKLAVEIDGSQHWLKESKIKRDKEKTDHLILKGWKIYRIPEFKLKKEFEETKLQFLQHLKSIDVQPKLFTFDNEIIEYEKIKQQKRLQKELQQQKRHNLQQLIINNRIMDVKKNGQDWGYISKLSKLWNVSHTQVRRFLEKYCPEMYFVS
jgi:very-short-patch-repair endonuclease